MKLDSPLYSQPGWAMSFQNPYTVGAALVIIAYLSIYFLFLEQNHFIPYVFDNNETFSSLIHAKNILLYGIRDTYGLTDESLGALSNAHPYVYTHQGNFPRLLTLLLYSLGIKSVANHIVITTFTIGLAGMWFCYHFFAKHITPVFAMVFCILLMTDYIMFMQWQVNTWRVWHLFFFFSSLLCCDGVNGKRKFLFYFLGVINFCCLFYMEISYAFFVLSTCLFYMIFHKQQRSWTKIAIPGGIFCVGGLLGLSILLAQHISYLGWDIFFKDITYTFTARNQHGPGESAFKKMVIEFYTSHKIVFWDNFGAEGLRSPINVIKNIVCCCLAPYSLVLTISAVTMTIATLCAYLENRISSLPEAAAKYPVTHMLNTPVALYTVLFIYLLILSICGYVKPLYAGLFLFSVYIFFQYILLNKKACFIIYYLILSTTFVMIIRQLAKESDAAFLNHFFHTMAGKAGVFAYWLGNVALGMFIILDSQEKWVHDAILQPLKKMGLFFVAAFCGFCAAYFVFPGYITTGYLYRYCCFTVFFHMVLYAWFFYAIGAMSYHYLSAEKRAMKLAALLIRYCKVAGATLVLLTASVFWVHLQQLYVYTFPAGEFNFIRLLGQRPSFGSSIVSNTYSAPFSYLSNNWAYMDPGFGMSSVTYASNKLFINRVKTYLWLADANSNPQYLNPQLFVCWMSSSYDGLTRPQQKCGNLPLVALSRSKQGEALGLREIASDTSGNDRWSIINIEKIHT